MKKYLALLISLLALSLLVSGASAAQNQNTATHPVIKTKMVKVNKEFRVVLKSNPTTGYSWMAKFDPKYIQLVSSRYVPYKTGSDIAGSGGVQILTFKAIKLGISRITLEYQRPWAETVPPLKEVKYIIFAFR
ncbi:protease inhibitor I42 family protein [Methanobacterium sp.]|uniref:protease inhibitor I42 family protein n=1 Tax=Methanobacterium sp. TaxID=2164 RepID=UPI003C71F87E